MHEKEKEELSLVEENRKASTEYAEQIKKFKHSLGKEKLKRNSLSLEFLNSTMGKKCDSLEMGALCGRVVQAVAAYSDAVTPLYIRQLERLHDIQRKQGRHTAGSDAGDSIIEAYQLFNEDKSEVSIYTKPKLFFKIHDGLLQELGRLVSDSHSISIDSTLEELEKSKLELELGAVAGPLLTVKKVASNIRMKKDSKKALTVPKKIGRKKSETRKSPEKSFKTEVNEKKQSKLSNAPSLTITSDESSRASSKSNSITSSKNDKKN